MASILLKPLKCVSKPVIWSWYPALPVLVLHGWNIDRKGQDWWMEGHHRQRGPMKTSGWWGGEYRRAGLRFNSSSPGQNWRHFADDIFKYIFLNENVLILIKNFLEVCSQWSNYRYASIGSDNGLTPTRRQAIIWTNADPIHWRIHAALGGDELI